MVLVDARGDACPLPVVKAKQAIAQLEGPGQVEVLVDNEIAVQNLTKMARQKGYETQAEKQSPGQYRVLFTVGQVQEAAAPAPACTPDVRTGAVVAIDSAQMGQGSAELGQALLKAFVFALTPAGPAAPAPSCFITAVRLFPARGRPCWKICGSWRPKGWRS